MTSSAPTVRRRLSCSADDVWATLADGWLYPLFVVGASRMREVDDDWPGVGSEVHHSFGAWPAVVDDTTTVTACEPGLRLRLVASGRPGGEAEVEFRLSPATASGPGDGAVCDVELAEDVVSGPALLVPRILRRPAVVWRNTETLRRLAFVAERRTAG
ncbi:SRPBCC family protein [Nocardioides lentus]|uniref:SRPBCC family protein n=1 Tax=Nocardioides lentus TaxID=338077 RepID=A0ABN2PRV2_9ACTN